MQRARRSGVRIQAKAEHRSNHTLNLNSCLLTGLWVSAKLVHELGPNRRQTTSEAHAMMRHHKKIRTLNNLDESVFSPIAAKVPKLICWPSQKEVSCSRSPGLKPALGLSGMTC